MKEREWNFFLSLSTHLSCFSFLPFMLPLFLHLTVICLSYITIKLSYQMNERKRRKRRELKERRKIYFPSFTFSFLDGLLLFFVFCTSYFFHCLFFIISSAFYNFLPFKGEENRNRSKKQKEINKHKDS